jgi:PhnB protein
MAHLHFKGNCREAFDAYARLFGGEVVFAMTYGQTPEADRSDPALKDRLAHARVDFKGQFLLGCDPPPDRYVAPQGFNVMAMIDDPQEAGRVFTSLAERGTVIMPFQQTFWAYRFGMCNDRFGIPWMINCEKAP